MAPLDERPVGVSADNRREPRGGGIEIECMAVVQHIEGFAMESDDLRCGQVGARPLRIDVAAYRGDRGQVAERIQDRWVADVAGMEDVARRRARLRSLPGGANRGCQK